MKTRLTMLLAALVLAGCVTAPAALTGDPVPTLPASFKGGDGLWARSAPAESQPRGTWWAPFADPTLDALLQRADAGNAGLQAAAARLAQARALVRGADAARRPQLNGGAGAARATTPGAGPAAATLLSVGADLSYEVDLFGRLTQTRDAAALDAASREALLQNTRLLVQAEVAQRYFALRAIDAERELVQATVLAYRDTLRLIERRYQAGDVAELDVARVRSEVAATEAEALALERQRTVVENAIAVLVGEPASSFRIDTQPWAQGLPAVPAGVPSALLARRPDVSAAQRSLQAAQARLGVAQTAWLPSLALTASGGYASPELGDLLKWSARSFGIGALLSLPIFDGGRREAGIAQARADLDLAFAGYREQVLVAFKDVEDELASLRLLADQAEAQHRAVDAAARATTLSGTRYRNGLVSQLELLDAQRSELRNRRQALQVRAAQYGATVGLIRALGGGWSAGANAG